VDVLTVRSELKFRVGRAADLLLCLGTDARAGSESYLRRVPFARLTSTTREGLLAAGLAIAVELELALSDHLWTPGRGLAALLITLPLALRLRHPLPTLTGVVVGVVVLAALGNHGFTGPVFPAIAVLLALYAVGSRTRGSGLVIAGCVSLGGLFAAGLLAAADPGGSFAVALLVTASGLLVGGALGVLRFESETFDERAAELVRARDEHARVAVADERRRIARELHDVIGHSISVMGVQAGAVRSVLRDDQKRERDALLQVERTGREAVGEMRRLIGLLRPDQDGVGEPTPSLRRVEQLVSEMQTAGLAVRLSVRGDLERLSAGLDLAGYRILQEALTNALKHAARASVEASVACTDAELQIDVINGGDAPSPGPSEHVGHGLLGMRERVALYGGELSTGPRDDGGFAVHARLPLEVP
jgi:signal transduction histidine kinase